MKAYKDLTLEQRTQIGQFYKDGMKATAIAPLYGTDVRAVNNVISFLRKSGMQIPYKTTPWKKKEKPTTPELLVLPEEKPVEKKEIRTWTNSEKRHAYQAYRAGSVRDVMKMFNTTDSKAYYLIAEGRALSGVKGKRNHTVKETPVVKEPTVAKESSEIQSDNVGFFALGVVVSLLAYWIL